MKKKKILELHTDLWRFDKNLCGHFQELKDEISERIREIENNVKNFVKMSSSYKFCVIATGEFDLYVAEPRAYEWDIAAGHAIVKHAGGLVTTHDEKEFKYGKSDYKNLALLVRRSENLKK